MFILKLCFLLILLCNYSLNHKNHNKLDNRPENLEPIRHDVHAKEHIKIREEVKKETFEERKRIEKKIIAVAENIRNNEFEPQPDDRKCNYCDYREFLCPSWESNNQIRK